MRTIPSPYPVPIVPVQAWVFDPAQGVRNYFATVETLNADAFLGLFAPDGMLEDPVGTPPFCGLRSIRDWFSAFTAGFRRIEIAPEEILTGSATEAAAEWTARGETLDGRTIRIEGIAAFRFNDEGKLRQVREYWDLPGILWSAFGGPADLDRLRGRSLRENLRELAGRFLRVDLTVARTIPVSDTELALHWDLKATVASGRQARLDGTTLFCVSPDGQVHSAEELWNFQDFLDSFEREHAPEGGPLLPGRSERQAAGQQGG